MEIDICVVAHNEQERIIESLVHIENAIQMTQAKVKVAIIANGCRDFTVEQCQYFCASHTTFTVYNIELGDKANAWNYFVYQVQKKYDKTLTVFIDGDCFISSGSLNAMLKAYDENPNVNAIAAYPATVGGDNLIIKKRMLTKGDFAGNFYALSPAFLTKIKLFDFRLPTGLIGDDSLLVWVCGNNLSIKNKRNPENYTTAIGALYYYERLIPSSYKNIKKYLTRLDRYSLRRLQQICIRCYVDELDFKNLPHNIEAIYQYQSYLSYKTIRWNFINTYYDIKNLIKIKRSLVIKDKLK